MVVYVEAMRTRYVMVVLGALSVGWVAAADSQCMYAHQFYGANALSCQDGTQMKCIEGRWQATGSQCADEAGDPTGKENQPGVVQPPIDSD